MDWAWERPASVQKESFGSVGISPETLIISTANSHSPVSMQYSIELEPHPEMDIIIISNDITTGGKTQTREFNRCIFMNVTEGNRTKELEILNKQLQGIFQFGSIRTNKNKVKFFRGKNLTCYS